MAKLLMITGDRSLAQGKRGAFYNTLQEFHQYWERIDIICPGVTDAREVAGLFGNVYVHPSPWPLSLQPLWIRKKGKQIFKEQQFDLVTVHEYPPFYNGIGARLLWRKIKVPYLLEIHHIPGHPKSGSTKEEIYRSLSRLFLEYDAKQAVAVRVVNKKESVDFLKDSGVDEKKIVYIPSMYIDLETFKPMSVAKQYDVVFAARLEKNKGIFNLIDAVKLIIQKKPDIKFLIIGQGSQKKNLESRIKDLGLEHSIIFSGWLATPQNVARAYNSATIFVNSSFNEGGPRVVPEAMACGLPVITTRVGLMNDIIKDGENGLFIDWSAKDTAEKILYLLSNPLLQKLFAEINIQTICQFEKKMMIKNYAEKLKLLG